MRSEPSVNLAFPLRGYATFLKEGLPRFALVYWGEVKTGEAGAGAALGAQPGGGEGVREEAEVGIKVYPSPPLWLRLPLRQRPNQTLPQLPPPQEHPLAR